MTFLTMAVWIAVVWSGIGLYLYWLGVFGDHRKKYDYRFIVWPSGLNKNGWFHDSVRSRDPIDAWHQMYKRYLSAVIVPQGRVR